MGFKYVGFKLTSLATESIGMILFSVAETSSGGNVFVESTERMVLDLTIRYGTLYRRRLCGAEIWTNLNKLTI